jgi:hypothetical protein
VEGKPSRDAVEETLQPNDRVQIRTRLAANAQDTAAVEGINPGFGAGAEEIGLRQTEPVKDRGLPRLGGDR